MSDAPVAVTVSEESGRRVELHDDRVKRAFREFDDYRVQEIVPDGGTPIIDDREESTNCSHKFDHDYQERDRDAVWIRFECADCGERWRKFRSIDAAFAFLLDDSDEDRGDGDIMTDGGENTYLDGREEWFLIGLVENALTRREKGRWEACRRLVQQVLARLDRGTRAHRLVRDGCCSSHPSSSQWREALERAKTALEVRDR